MFVVGELIQTALQYIILEPHHQFSLFFFSFSSPKMDGNTSEYGKMRLQNLSSLLGCRVPSKASTRYTWAKQLVGNSAAAAAEADSRIASVCWRLHFGLYTTKSGLSGRQGRLAYQVLDHVGQI